MNLVRVPRVSVENRTPEHPEFSFFDLFFVPLTPLSLTGLKRIASRLSGWAGFRSGGRVNDETWNRERLGNLLLFGQALQSSKAFEASSDIS